MVKIDPEDLSGPKHTVSPCEFHRPSNDSRTRYRDKFDSSRLRNLTGIPRTAIREDLSVFSLVGGKKTEIRNVRDLESNIRIGRVK